MVPKNICIYLKRMILRVFCKNIFITGSSKVLGIKCFIFEIPIFVTALSVQINHDEREFTAWLTVKYRTNHANYIPINIQQDATLHSLFISVNCSTCFGWYLHPSSGAHKTVSTASGTC